MAHDDLKRRIQRSHLLLKTGSIEEAEKQFAEIVKDSPDTIQGHAGLATAAQRLENWDLALNRWEKVIEIAPDHLNAKIQRSNMLLKTGSIEEAEKQFAEIVKDSPDTIQGHAGLATAAQRLENWELALNRWQKVIEIAPDHLNAKIQRANMLLKTGSIEEAEKQFAEIVKDSPDTIQGHAGLATAAQRLENWELALNRWQKVIEIAPDHLNAKIQRSNMLLKTGSIEEAEKQFAEIVKDSPDAIQGHAGLMTTARIQADWAAALKAASAVSERCEPTQPLFARVAQTTILALVRLNRITEAEEAVKRFKNTELPDEDKFFLTATILQEQHRWMDALAWYRRHKKLVMENTQLVFKYLHILLWCGFPAEAYCLLKKYLKGKPDLQNWERFLCISTLEKIGKVKLAVRWLLLMVAKQGPGILNQDMVLLLVSTLLEQKQYERFFSLVGRIKADETITVNSIRCKFTALIFEALANHLSQHHQISQSEKGTGPSVADVPLRDQLARQIYILRNANRLQQTCSTLDGFFRSYQQIEERFSRDHFLVNTFFNPWESYRLVYFLIDRIRRRQPTSLVRLGDCEGNFLPYPEQYRRHQAGDRETCTFHWWETKLGVQDTDRISTELTKAIYAADIIGIPEPAHMILDLPVPTPRDLFSLSMNWRGKLNILHHLIGPFTGKDKSFLPPRILTASLVNYDLELWGGYDLILQSAPACSVICSHPKIANALRSRFDLDPWQVIMIPPERKFSHRAFDPSNRSHFPEFFEEVSRTLTVIEPGEVFLVAAGILGKSYCSWIKERGGIALDVGSMIDFWCGARTRRNSMHARAAIGESIRRQSLENSRRVGVSFQCSPVLLKKADRDTVIHNSLREPFAHSQHDTQPEPFILPQPFPDSCDSYIIRSGIKKSLHQHLSLFNGTLLDVGCGQMPYRKFILETNPCIEKYIGLDFSAGRYADLQQPDITWDGKIIPLEDFCIDCAMATEVLEHCPEPLPVLKEIRRVLKPDGVFFFTTPFLWPLHDTPHDHYRYTPYSLERLLSEAGFEDIQIRSLGGWDASLAQMIGLWLKRAPMNNDRRKQMTRDLFPLYKHLAEQDKAFDTSFGSDFICPGWSGLAYRPLQYVPEKEIEIASEQRSPKICLVRSVSSGYSETFIDDHIAYLSNQVEVLHGSPFPMFNIEGQSVLDPESSEVISIARDWEVKQRIYTEALALYLKKTKFDVFFTEYGTNGIKVYKACREAGLPCVVQFLGFDASKQSVLRRFKKEYEEMFFSAAFLVVVSTAMMEKLISLGAPKEKVLLNPCGVSIARHDLSLPEQSPPVFLSVGRFVEKKAPDLTIRSFSKIAKKIPNSRLIMVGDGPLFPRCEKLVQRLGIQHNVVFTGVQSRRSLAKLFRLSRAFVQHSIIAPDGDSEGLPVAILEAGAAGLPVISTRHAGIPDAVIDGENGFLVDEKDVEGMAEAMLTLARDPKLAGRMGRNYRKRVVEHFSRQKSITGLRRIIDNSLKSASDQPAFFD
ncbi:MAG: glycosyltransferase [Thermodesulfobacteriota bacterium]|nr:glycosyltransferase [Thermodesulfobacteriota bacterium]